MQPTFYLFDLDGTVTTCEILPRIAHELRLTRELELLTQLTLDGTLDFESSFRLRFHILRSVPLAKVHAIVASIPMHPTIEAFIRQRTESCYIVTGNLDCWIEPLLHRLGCRSFTSRSEIVDGQLELVEVLNKGTALRTLAREKKRLIAIGESFNDIPMFEEADIGIAYGGVHEPIQQLIQIADYVTYDGDTLCELLTTL